MMGLLEGISKPKLTIMSRKPLVSEMRKIYGRPTLTELLHATSKNQKFHRKKRKKDDNSTKNNQEASTTFIVKRHPFKRLFSGFDNKILRAFKGSHHDKMAQKILQDYRGMDIKRDYKFKKTVPKFAEFVEFVIDNYETNGEIDMHWAPVVDFCSVCKVIQFESFK